MWPRRKTQGRTKCNIITADQREECQWDHKTHTHTHITHAQLKPYQDKGIKYKQVVLSTIYNFEEIALTE